jgi:phosphatidylserine decarboxylase
MFALILLMVIVIAFGQKTSIIVATVILVIFVLFFRAPNIYLLKIHARRQPDDVFLCPCYGTVSNIFLNDDDDKIVISIFLSIFDIHSQYIPCQSILQKATYKDGFFEMAQVYEKTKNNERMIWDFDSTEFGKFRIEQVAGFIARSIVMFAPTKPGSVFLPADELGMIRFGSRVTVTLDRKEGMEVLVKVGDKVQGPYTRLVRKRAMSSLDMDRKSM